MKKLVLLAIMVIASHSLFGDNCWSDAFKFDGREITEDPILLLPNDNLAYSSSLIYGIPKYLTITVKDTFDLDKEACLFENYSDSVIEGTVCWDYNDEKFKDFPTDDIYLLTETVVSDKDSQTFNRIVTILPEPVYLSALTIIILLLRIRKINVLFLLLITISFFVVEAEGSVKDVKCQQMWPFDRSVIVNYALDFKYASVWFDVKFYGSIDGGETVFDLAEKGTLHGDGADGKIKGIGKHKAIWKPDDTFFSVNVENMKIMVEANVISKTFEYKLITESDNTLPVFSVSFFGVLGNGSEYLLENIGTIEGDGIGGIALGTGVRRIIWYPNDNFVQSVGNIKLNLSCQEITDQATYLILDLNSYKIRASKTGPNIKDDACRLNELWLKRIGPGSFYMGSPEDELGRLVQERRIKVSLTRAYYMAIFETTQRQFEKITGFNPSYQKDSTHPVARVSYAYLRGSKKGCINPSSYEVDDDSFMGLLRHKTGLVFDLPTEAQWERTCRAGTTTALNNGKNLKTRNGSCPNTDEVAWYFSNSTWHHSVGEKRVNKWGFYDMHGNIMEWCLDCLNFPYFEDSLVDPLVATSGRRKIRGGGFQDFPSFCRSAFQSATAEQNFSKYDLGFRLALISPD